jgi:hypothetical protein
MNFILNITFHHSYFCELSKSPTFQGTLNGQNEALASDPLHTQLAKHFAARKLIHAGKVKEAWMLLLV